MQVQQQTDMDEYIRNGYDYNALGPKSKAFYDERAKLLQPASNSQDVSNIKFPSPVMPVSGNSGYTINDEKDADQARKNIRKLYANDNAGYKNAIREAGVDVGQDPNAKYKMKSIQQAYYDGEIDKNTRDYLLADTLGKFARNMGKDISNISAAYSGGTVNNEREGSAWDARNEAMMSAGVNAEQNKVAGSTNEQQYRSGEAQITSQELNNRIKELQKLKHFMLKLMTLTYLLKKDNSIRCKLDFLTWLLLLQLRKLALKSILLHSLQTLKCRSL